MDLHIQYCRVTVFWLGPATDRDPGPADPVQWIYREWVQKLGSDGATACVKIGDDQAGAKNRTRRPNASGERTPHLRIWIPALSLPTLWEIFDIIYPFLWFIIFLHLLVIHVYSWVHVPSATPSNALWAVVALIALSRGHVHINGVRALVVGI